MTPDTLEYLLRATVIWAVLLAYHYFALRQTSFRFQRFYLLGGLLFGVVVPLLPALAVGGGLPVAGLAMLDFTAPVFIVEAGNSVVEKSWNWWQVLPWLYLLGAAFFGARTLVQWKVLWQWITTGTQSEYAGHCLVRHPGIPAPFAAFGWIFLPAEMSDAGLESTALIHEAAHLRSRHHYDTLLLTLGSLLLWFHPLFWVFRRRLATVHEYEADAAVIQTVPARTYGLQLLQASLGPAGFSGLFSSPLKERIDMITNNNRARKLRLLPLLSLSLLLLGLVVACSDVGEDIATPLDVDNPFDSMAKDPFAQMDDANIQVAEENNLMDIMPRLKTFSGDATDEKAVMMHLMRNGHERIRYPKYASSSGTEGTIVVNAFFKESGELKAYDVGPMSDGEPAVAIKMIIVGYKEKGRPFGKPQPLFLNEEVLRLMEELQEIGFHPAMKDGKPVASMLRLSFKFMLED